MNTINEHAPLKRQLWIKERCIQVERQFSGRTGAEGFALRMLLGGALLLFWYRELAEVEFIPNCIRILFLLAGAYYGMLVMVHRYHDIGKSGSNMLIIAIPFLIWGVIAKQVPEKYVLPVVIILFIWPALEFIRLCLQPGKEGATGYE